MEMYHFVTEWFFEAPIEAVWQEIRDVETWPTWWIDWKKAVVRNRTAAEAGDGVGVIIDCEVRGALPYSLHFSTKTTVLEPPYLSEYTSSGDLIGGGKWELKEAEGGTAVTYHWHVGMSNPIFNFFGKLPFTKNMMGKNHNEVMDRGYNGIKARLNQKQSQSPDYSD